MVQQGDTTAEIFAPVQAAFAALAADAPLGMPLVNQVKAAWHSARTQAAAVNRAQGGRAAGVFLANGADHLLTALLAHAAKCAGLPLTDIAVLAMGSYGRQELAPFSDIDLLVLHKAGMPDAALETLVGTLLRPLWDSGLHIGHAVRDPEECLKVMADTTDEAKAFESATSVLEARFVAGDRAFADSFLQNEVPAFFRRNGRSFVDGKFEETIKRWRGLSVYRTQPNVKESPGALRDFQLAVWIDRASQVSGMLPRLDNRPLVSKAAIDDAQTGYEKLLTFRVSLHALCARKQDVLDYPMQQAVAQDLKYEDSEDLKAAECLLRDYFRAATAVHRLAHTVTRRYLEERAVATRDIDRLRRRRIDDDFTRVGDYLYASHDSLFAGDDWFEPAMRAYLHAARTSSQVSQDVAEAIRTRLPEMNDAVRRNPAANANFLALLNQRANVGRALRAMRDLGLLAAYMPEFGEVQGLVISDVYHDFTVDEHTITVVEAMDRLYASVEDFDQFRREVMEALPRPMLLRLACLFHDLGKSRGAPGHSERGALMVPAIGERLGLNVGDVRTLIFLVQEHLTLSRVSQRRDPHEGQLLAEMAQKIVTRERLDLLYLLTYCDSISVGQGSYPLWKDALLAELYLGIAQRIAPSNGSSAALPSLPASMPVVPTSLRDEHGMLETKLLDWASNDSDRALATEHVRRVPPRYLAEVSVSDAISHLETLRSMRVKNRECAVSVVGSGDLVDMWVVSTDRPKRFSQICGAFLGAGVSVVSAIAYTRNDGIILDHFRVAPGLDAMGNDADFWANVTASVEDALTGKADVLKKIDAARRRIPRSSQISRRTEPEIRVDNKLSERFTVVDVICGDRIGLLYGLSRALADLSCDIHFAKIATNQGLVTDVFYITELNGGQVTDPEKMNNLKRLLKAVAADFQEARR